MEYKDVATLNADTRQFAQEVPSDIDLVVGIPRSGLLAANILCLYLDVPMTDVDGLCEGRIFDTGSRFDENWSFDTIDSVLVVDDSVNSGAQMTETRSRIEEHAFPFDIQYGAIYVSPDGHRHVDHWGEVVPTPRLFEWNLIHHPVLKDACVDIDGVLCRDPTPEENDDGERYREFISEVEPKIVPNQRIHRLVTCRLEKYRPETEAWLDAHGITYDTLVMMDLPDRETRLEQGNHARYKASVYRSTDSIMFIESDPGQAANICQQSKKPVFCYGTNEMIRPGLSNRAYRKTIGNLPALRENPVWFPIEVGRYLSERCYHLVSSRLRKFT